MLAIFASAAILLSGAQSPTEAFRASFAKRSSEVASTTVDPAIQKCMDIVSDTLRKETRANLTPEKIEVICTMFSKEVGKEETLTSDYRSLGASVAYGTGRVAIGIRMGFVGRLRVYSTVSGEAIPVPKALEWSYQYETNPEFLPGGMIAVDGPGIQDAGVRYNYRIVFLKPTDAGFQIAKLLRGIWTLDEDDHFSVKGTVATVNTIEEPKSFFTSNPVRLFVVTTIYELDKLPFRVRMTTRNRSAIQAADEWMAAAIKSPTTTLQKQFVASFGKERQMINEFSEKIINKDSYEVRLEFDKTYVFTVENKNMKETVKSMRIE